MIVLYINDLLLLEYGIYFNKFDGLKINKFSFNSKEIESNDAFVCINSGSNYIEEAIINGAVVIICDYTVTYQNHDILIIKTDNIYKLLSKVSEFILKKTNVKKIAITGSNGKTTTKELIYYVLKSKYKVLKNDGNKNNFLGLMDTIFKLKDHDFLVMEMGMNHLGEISFLSSILKPDIGIITNIGSAHIGNLGNKKNIFKAKMEIVDGNSNIVLFVNGNDKYLKKTRGIKVKKNDCNFTPAFDHMKTNYNLAIAVCEYLHFDKSEIINILSDYQMYRQRMNVIYKNSTIIIDDTYNASLESTIGGLSYVKKYKQDKIIILGDILETGKYSKKIHKKIDHYLKHISNKIVLLIGNHTNYIKGIHFVNHFELINYLDNININNKVIYLKGSRKMKLETIRDNLLLKF